ncbi:MAG: 6,7-dimethyl-8-ribityllumazine synthase, partial [Blastocatellia bacterium]
MTTTVQGKLNAEGLRFAIVASRWNDFVVNRLVGGAIDGLERLGASSDSITVVKVPGSFELPSVLKRVATGGKYDAIICVGAIIRG